MGNKEEKVKKEEVKNNTEGEKKEESKQEAKKVSMEDKLEQAEDKFLRIFSEYENFRKRTQKEKADLISGAAADVYKELDYLRQRNELISLGDLAIHNADRKSLDKLISIREKNSDPRLQSGAASEILRVKLAYMNGLRRGSQSIPIGQLFPEYDAENEVDLDTEQLISLLDDLEAMDAHRVRAAYLLADKRNSKAATALVNVVANDSNLDVVREAAMTFSEMTGFRNEDLLDVNSLINWWQKNSDKVLPDLKN